MKFRFPQTVKTFSLIIGCVFVFGSGTAFAAWTPSPKNTFDPLYFSDWNAAAHHASGWERAGDINAPGTDVFLNTTGGVGIGTNTISADLLLDVEGKAGAEEYCDENGGNCFRALDVTAGNNVNGTLPGGGLQIVNNEVGLVTVGCSAGQVIKYTGGSWQCADENNDLRNGYSCAANEILKFNGTDWVCAGDSIGNGPATCGNGEILKYDGANWNCAVDQSGGSGAGLTCAANQIMVYNGTDWVCAANSGGGSVWNQNGSNISYNSGLVSVGTDQADTLFTLVGNGHTNEGDFHHYSYSDNSIHKPDYRFLRARGTENAPAAPQDGDYLGDFSFWGYDGNAFREAINIIAVAKGTPVAGSDVPADLVFTNRTNDISRILMSLNENGSAGIGTRTPAAGLLLDVEGRVGATEYCNSDGAECVSAADLAGSASDTLGGLTCALNEIAKWDGSTWACAADNAAGGGYWNRTGDDIYYNSGKVGIGTAPDQDVDLHIAGDGEIALEDWSTGIYFNDLDDMDFILGTSLKDVEGPGLAVFRGNYDTGLWQRTMTIGDDGNITISGNGEGDITSVGRIADATELNGAFGTAVSGDYVYVVAGQGSRFQVIDVTDPKNPVIMGGIHDPVNLNNPIHVAVKGDYAYVAARGSNNLEVIDVSDPANPVSVGRLTDPINLAGIFDVVISGNRAYITAQESHNLEIVNISNPANPVSVGRLTDPVNLQKAKGLSVSGGYAYVAAEDADNLEVIDVSDPTDPISVGRLTDPVNLDMAWDVAVAGKYAFVSAYGAGNLEVVDISDPTNPVSVGRLTDPAHLDGATDVDVSGNFAFVMSAYTDNMEIIDISDPTNPVNYGRLTDTVNLSGPRNVSIHGNYAYVTAIDSDNFEVIDIGSVFGGGSLFVDGEAGIGTRNLSDGLRLDVEGRVGATEYCDETGNNCYTTAEMAGGGTGGGVWNQNGSEIYYDAGDVLIGTDGTLPVHGTGSYAGFKISGNGKDVHHYSFFNNAISDADYRFLNARGTANAPESLQDGDAMGGITFAGYGDTDYDEVFEIRAMVSGSPVPGKVPGDLHFITTPNTTGGTKVTQMILKDNGSLGIGTTTVNSGLKLDVEGRVGATEYCNSDGTQCRTIGDLISGSGGTGSDTLADLNCAVDQVAQWNGNAWVCASVSGSGTGGGDNWGTQVVQSDTTLSGSGTTSDPLSVNASNIQRRVGNECPPGSAIRRIEQDGSVICELDDGGGSDTLTGLTCLSGQVVKYNGTSWACANDSTGTDNDWVVNGNNMSSGVTGKVGIGTTTPAADAKLEVRGGTIRATDGLIIEVRTSDPSGTGLVNGRMWLRSDL